MFNRFLSSPRPNGFIRQHKSAIFALIKLSDILIIIALFFIFLGSNDYVVEGRKITILLIGFLTFEFFATINNLYGLRRGVGFVFVIKNIVTAWLCAIFAVMIVIKFSTIVEADHESQVLYWLLVTPIAVIGWHLIIRLVLNYVRSFDKNARRVAIIGATNLGLDLEKVIIKQTWLGYSFIGSVDTINAQMQAFIDTTQLNEVMVTSHIFDHEAKMHSYDLFAQAMKINRIQPSVLNF